MTVIALVTKELRKNLPSPNDANFNDRVRESLMTYLGQQGSRLDRGVTLRDLSAAGINLSARFLSTGQGAPFGDGLSLAGPGGSTTVIGGPGSVYIPDLTPPPTPTGFVATAAITSVLAECSAPSYTVGHGHFVSRLYGSKPIGAGADPTFSDAVRLGEFGGTVWAYVTEPATRWFLWLKWVSKDGVESVSPAGGLHGIQVDTGQDVSRLLNAITKAAETPTAAFTKLAIRATLFYVVNDTPGVNSEAGLFSVITAPITVGGVEVPVGVYMRDGYIQNGTITNLKVANGAIDNLKVANVSASKLTAGSISVGEYIQSAGYLGGLSGWKIDGSGNAELNNVVVRGFGYFGGGSVGGIIVEATRIRSSNYVGQNGTGFMLASDGTLDLPNGSVNAQKINVGFGVNLLTNSGWVERNGAVPVGWSYGGSLAYMTTLQIDTGNAWTPTGSAAKTIYMVQVGRNGDANINGAYTDVAGGQFPCVAGKRYEFSAYLAAYRCTGQIYCVFTDANGNGLDVRALGSGEAGDTGPALGGGGGGGRLLANYYRYGRFMTAPAGAAQAYMIVRKGDTYAGATDSYLFMPCGCQIAEATASQTVFSPLSKTGLGTLITPAGIVTPSIAALSANLGSISAGTVTIGSDNGGSWGYIRSPNKWLDGTWGWIMAQHPNGSMFVDFTIGSSRFYMHHNAGVSATMVMDTPGLYFDSNGTLQVRAANVINTLNVAGNAITAAGYMEGRNIVTTPANIGTVYNFNTDGGPIIAMICIQILPETYFTGGEYGSNITVPGGQIFIYIRRSDGAIVWSGSTSGGSLTAYFGGAGYAHYSIEAYGEQSSSVRIGFRSMVLLVCKR